MKSLRPISRRPNRDRFLRMKLLSCVLAPCAALALRGALAQSGAADPTSLHGKVMCGYQGWFRTPGDGTRNGWRSDPPAGDSPFLAEPSVPGDHYLWLTGLAGRLLRGELRADSVELPSRTQ